MLWIRDVLSSFDIELNQKMVLHEDNQACIAICSADVVAKHVGVKTAVLREQINLGNLEMVYYETKEMTADILKKALPEPQHERLTAKLGLGPKWGSLRNFGQNARSLVHGWERNWRTMGALKT